MSRERISSWPFLFVLAGLFVLSVAAPRGWRKIAHHPAPRVATKTRRTAATAARRQRPTRNEIVSPEAVALRPAAHHPAAPRPLERSKPIGKILSEVKPMQAPDDAPVEASPKIEPAPAIELPVEPQLEPGPSPGEPPAANTQPKALVAVRERPQRGTPDLQSPPTLQPARSVKGPAPDGIAAKRKHRSLKKPAEAQGASKFWQLPEVLMANLDRLALDCEATEWATRTGDLIRELCRLEGPQTARAAEIVTELQALAASERALEKPLADPRSAAAWRRIHHALVRHVQIWQLTPELARTSKEIGKPASAERSRLSNCLAEVAALTDGDPAGRAWRQYLQFDALSAMARRGLDETSQRELVRRVLAKLERASLDERQRQFIAAGPLAALDHELHHWTAEPIDPGRLLLALERFEESGLPSDAQAVAQCVRKIADWPGSAAEKTQAWLDANYRSSNLRVSISAEFLNRLVPRQDPIEAPVRDRILGVPTRGWSTTTADLGVRLIPDPHRVHLALEVQGQVSARTTSRSGPATFYSHSDGEYLARKELTIGLAGLHTQPAQADASSSPELRAVETDYDYIPLIGLVIEEIARAKHAEQEGAVRRIAQQRVASRVQEELDAAVESKLKLANEQFRTRVLKPLKDLSLEPAVVGMQTSEQRLTLRMRLAADEQLAACTPRPQALSDSLVSAQIHQSLLNNVCERLRLDGASFTLPDLQRHLAHTLGLDPATFSEEYPSDMQIKFAPRDAVRIRFISGRIQATLAIAELNKRPAAWRDFQVRVHYKPVRRGMQLSFVRDGTVQLWGERFGAQPQIALRGIFSRVFSQDRQLSLLEPKQARDPRLAGLEFTQCVVTDGWLGLSIGPRRVQRTASKR